ncbi:Z1 domain-containing protein [Pseudoclavibacter sp. 13-3]|uniref:Z1 domain-containing protein n=1 Tax=Pseudoclavibacter sp. 13-3 TaxID=2901228 RepID=UPI001E5A680C|nr:Z1 domain-containing protein [Pseudoclavibacter sp. 13-3]MCD7100723.1 Z1 domain-containing protein [Pseudoclavibacter sp. 13-3]
MANDDEAVRTVLKVLRGLRGYGPENILEKAQFELRHSDTSLGEEGLVEILTDEDVNSAVVVEFRILLGQWDAVDDEPWSAGTAPHTSERRAHVYDLLGFCQAAVESIDEAYPPRLKGDVFIVDKDWTPWYTPERRRDHDFYWTEYAKVLGRKLPSESVIDIDTATTKIVSRLADPTAAAPYQSKGLVVGHVQSGKTANFTGVIAKAIDAGYRLIIVLTGTVELLRTQTQRRLDMELIGKENILGGRDENNSDALSDVDYAHDGDIDWYDGKFVSHGIDFGSGGAAPAIKRLTGKSGDYKSLKAGLDTLDFRSGNELRKPALPVWNEQNVFGTDVRIAVVKKNKSVLKKLVHDLKNVRASLNEIPALIIDDEADQASVNTVNPKKRQTPGNSDRTAINSLISQLLHELKRAQYIGYTATPFANVFISPEDSEDIFPRDFIVSLTPPSEYMGGRKFHDLEPLSAEAKRDPAFSNEAAFVRGMVADDEQGELDELRAALDTFVLTGAIKLWRKAHGFKVKTDHHTMLVHESVKQIEHKALASLIVREWSRAGFSSPRGLERLRDFFETDIRPVSESRLWDAPLPERFEELKRFIGKALDQITVSRDPVVVINGDKESEYEQIDFDKEHVWRILVGGTKLSRGFTVEGLTVTYYRRRSMQADTLMQMGRWFGYRPGYQDLVRLFIARKVFDGRGKEYDLYEAFQTIVEDEEDFRNELETYAGEDDSGEPLVRPIDVPPMVFQQLPWLKPTSRNKMYNAQIEYKGVGGKLQDFPRQPDRGKGENNRVHFRAVEDWLLRLGDVETFDYYDKVTEKTRHFLARSVIVSAEEMLNVLEQFRWVDGFDFLPTLKIMRDAITKGLLHDWAVLVPYLGKQPVLRAVDSLEIPILKRKRREDRAGFSGSSFRQRGAIERIAGNTLAVGGEKAEKLYTPTRGAMLLTFAADPAKGKDRSPEGLPLHVKTEDIATIFSLAIPKNAAPKGRIGFTVRNREYEDQPIVSAEDGE